MRRRDISSMCFPFLALGLNPEVHSSVTSYCTILSQWVFLRRKDEENTAHHHPTHWESILWREPDTETSEQIKEEKTAPRPQIFVHQHLHFQKKKKKKSPTLVVLPLCYRAGSQGHRLLSCATHPCWFAILCTLIEILTGSSTSSSSSSSSWLRQRTESRTRGTSQQAGVTPSEKK